jgi:hypothetical protein
MGMPRSRFENEMCGLVLGIVHSHATQKGPATAPPQIAGTAAGRNYRDSKLRGDLDHAASLK